MINLVVKNFSLVRKKFVNNSIIIYNFYKWLSLKDHESTIQSSKNKEPVFLFKFKDIFKKGFLCVPNNKCSAMIGCHEHDMIFNEKVVRKICWSMKVNYFLKNTEHGGKTRQEVVKLMWGKTLLSETQGIDIFFYRNTL